MHRYQAALHAEYVHNELLQAHAYSHAEGMEMWERGAIERALEHLDKLNAIAPALRERLADLRGEPRQGAAA